MGTAGVSGNALSATRPASGLVAFESLYQRTPSHSPTSSRRCSTPWNDLIAASIASSLKPAMRPTAAAAIAFSRLWRPGSGIGGTRWGLSQPPTGGLGAHPRSPDAPAPAVENPQTAAPAEPS